MVNLVWAFGKFDLLLLSGKYVDGDVLFPGSILSHKEVEDKLLAIRSEAFWAEWRISMASRESDQGCELARF